MVEFPLVGPAEPRVLLAPPGRIYPRNLPPADIKILSSSGVSGLAGMWETNTFKASFQARLNVASRAWNHAEIPLTLKLLAGTAARGAPLHFVTNCAAPWQASGSAPAACRP